MKGRWAGFYATKVALPLSSIYRRWRRLRHLSGTKTKFVQPTRLPTLSWQQTVHSSRAPSLLEPKMINGNVRLSELAVLACLARECPIGSALFEIGTFDGRTTLNLALNAPANCTVYTLDIPAEATPRYAIAKGERHLIRKRPSSEPRWEKYRNQLPEVASKIQRLWSDSATFDYTPYRHTCSLVFVDGSHAYEYAISDSRAAMELVTSGGSVIWHDYGVWAGVTKALDELRGNEGLTLKNIRGTSLVFWRKPTTPAVAGAGSISDDVSGGE